jgi:hypothetical protein
MRRRRRRRKRKNKQQIRRSRNKLKTAWDVVVLYMRQREVLVSATKVVAVWGGLLFFAGEVFFPSLNLHSTTTCVMQQPCNRSCFSMRTDSSSSRGQIRISPNPRYLQHRRRGSKHPQLLAERGRGERGARTEYLLYCMFPL